MPKPIRCILLVDDDPDDNYLHQLVIAESGQCEEVRVAESGFQALDYLTQTDHPDYVRPEVILLDINMPGMSGFEFLERYHQLPEPLKSRLVLLMLTTSLNPSDRQRADGTTDITGYQNKPLTQAMLHQIVGTYFARPV